MVNSCFWSVLSWFCFGLCSLRIKIKIRFIHLQGNTRNYSTFNPSRLAPGEHTHAHTQGHTLMETGAIHWSSGQPMGAWGYSALLKGTLAVARRWTATPPAVSSPIFLSGESGNQTAIGWPSLTTDSQPNYSWPKVPVYSVHPHVDAPHSYSQKEQTKQWSFDIFRDIFCSFAINFFLYMSHGKD